MKKKHFGFSLIELLVVIVIIGILSLIAAGTFQGYFGKARDARRQAFVSTAANIIKSKEATEWSNTKYVLTAVELKDALRENDVTIPTGEDLCYFYSYNAGTGSQASDNEFFLATWSEDAENVIVDGTADAVDALNGLTNAVSNFVCDTSTAPTPTGYTTIKLDATASATGS